MGRLLGGLGTLDGILIVGWSRLWIVWRRGPMCLLREEHQ